MQAHRRVSAGSLGKMVRKVLSALPGVRTEHTGRFFYPRGGFGQISRAYSDACGTRGVDVKLDCRVDSIGRVLGARQLSVNRWREPPLDVRLLLSTIPLPALVELIRSSAPSDVLHSARALVYRSMLLVYLVLETDRFTEFDAHYFPGLDVSITRLSEPKNYGLCDASGVTVLCAELPCSTDSHWWRASDSELGALVLRDLETAGLRVSAKVRRVAVRRLAQAYPIYTRSYREHFDRIDQWVGTIDGLLTFGRQGLFAHDNTHHTLAMAYAAAECVSDAGRSIAADGRSIARSSSPTSSRTERQLERTVLVVARHFSCRAGGPSSGESIVFHQLRRGFRSRYTSKARHAAS